MATEKPTPPEGSKAVEAQPDVDEPEVELDPGEVLQGILLSIKSGENTGEYGTAKWHLLRVRDTVDGRGIVRYFAEGGAKAAATRGDLEEGQEYWICKDVTEDEYEGNPFYPVELHEV
jgi:hypothetical protein